MNKNLLNKKVQDYINANLQTDLHSLLLKKSPFPAVTMSEIVQQIKGKNVAKKKFSFLEQSGIVFPKGLSLEQASSMETATYKQNLVSGETMVDLTAGFGIDAFYLSEGFQKVSLVERQKELLDIVAHNWKKMGKSAHFINENLETFLSTTQETFDVIYLDPARRNENQQKVFLLEDLSPNILEIQHQLVQLGKQIVIKLSPLIDISYLLSELKFVRAIHIIAVKNDVKELVVVMEQNYHGEVNIHTVNLGTTEPSFSFVWNNDAEIQLIYSEALAYLYIPNNALLKSGYFNGIARAFDLKKLDANTHLYTSDRLLERFPGRVLSVEKISAKQIKKGEYYNIVSKNHPMKPAQIKKKYRLKDGGKRYLIFTQSKKEKIILKSYDKS